jgi:amino acid transporter
MILIQKRGLTTIALVLLISGAIDSIRNLPTIALFGSSLIFFFVLSAIIFLIPAALVSAELSSSYPNKGGIFHWTHLAFGENMAAFSVWLQWINTMVWFPTILSFIAGTMTYFIDPSLAQNKFILVSIILAVFWMITLVNLRGIHASAKFANFCSLIGMVLPMILIISLAFLWALIGQPMQIQFSAQSLLPSLTHMDNWISLTAIMASFLGMELATVHINDVDKPQKTFPKALFFSVILILTTMILGSLAIAIVLPNNQINLVAGVMQAFTNFFAAYHMHWFIPIIAVMLVIGSIGNMISWVISPAKGLLQAAEYGFLMPFFAQKNQHGVASNLLIAQAVMVTFICMIFLFMPSVNSSYWLLTALSTQLYMIMYVIMFFAAIKLKGKNIKHPDAFSIMGSKKWGTSLVAALGLIGCVMTLIVGFIPPSGINMGNTLNYQVLFTIGMLVMMSPFILLYLYKIKNKTKSNIDEISTAKDPSF